MSNKFVIVVGLFCCLQRFTISDSLAGNPVDSTFSKHIFSFNLASPFDPNFPRYRIGYAQITSPRWMISWDAGIGRYGILPNSTFYYSRPLAKDYRLWEMRTEGRYFFLGLREHLTPYAAMELFYIHHTQTRFGDDYLPVNSIYAVHYEQAYFHRQKYGCHLKTGVIIKFNPHLAADLYAGAGFRLRKNTYSNVIQPSPGGSKWFEDYNYYYYEGRKWNFDLTFGVKLNILF